ncbi:MAG: Ppx/GppA family phosphatase [Actinomycetota bacterium]|nr:Ppx/GppA family phosphatase [Actinomycetota bacterium]
MRVAAIDVGTNSTRLLVAEETGGGFRPLDRRMVLTRLGEGVDARRRLAPKALKRTLATVADYAASCGEYEVERLRVTGTSAVRDAHNRDEFLDGVRMLTGQTPELLTGDEEARVTFLGAVSDLDGDDCKLVVDIGGGSTELVLGRREPESVVSMDVGSVRMFEKHLFSDPPTASEIDSLRADVTGMLEIARPEVQVPAGTRLIGVAGTVTQLATLKAGLSSYQPEVTHHAVLSHGDVRLMARRLASLPYEKRARVKGLEPGRVDVIVAGAEILLSVMEVFDTAEMLVSERDILDGLVIELLKQSTESV